MQSIVLKSKLFNLTITDAEIAYEGSIAIDKTLLRKARIQQYEQVHVLDVTNGARFITYAIKGEPGEVCINGAAAKLVEVGDEIIVLAYGLTMNEVEEIRPKIINGISGKGESSER
jgi:aspartate 1-decarboxylase